MNAFENRLQQSVHKLSGIASTVSFEGKKSSRCAYEWYDLGLQCMSSEHEEVRSIVEALAIKVDQMIPVSLLKGDGKVIPQDAMLTGQNIGNALW